LATVGARSPRISYGALCCLMLRSSCEACQTLLDSTDQDIVLPILYGCFVVITTLAASRLANFTGDADDEGLLAWLNTEFRTAVVHAAQALFTVRGVVLALMTVVGNLYEEVLFRAYWIHRTGGAGQSVFQAACSSAAAFSLFHAFLALQMPSAREGLALLAFTTWEGLVCTVVYAGHGLFAAALCHGTVIFLLSAKQLMIAPVDDNE
jgi:membrane protease YdiL (CAAX protease family)